VQWTDTFEADVPDADVSGSDASDNLDSDERALLINCEKVSGPPRHTCYFLPRCSLILMYPNDSYLIQGRVSSIIVKKCSLSSLWDLLVFWKCEIMVQNMHITLRRKKSSKGPKKTSFASTVTRKLLQQPWFWCAHHACECYARYVFLSG
jgi:hypothetical protein